MTDTPRKRLVGLGLLILCLGLNPAARAEDNVNPFSGFGNNNEGKGPDADAPNNDDSFDELDDEFGFQPPSDLIPPPADGSAPAPRADVKPADPPPRPEPRTPPPRTRSVPSRRNSPPPTLSKSAEPLTSIPGKKATAGPTGTKLAGYLELDPAVKGLQVKNFDLKIKTSAMWLSSSVSGRAKTLFWIRKSVERSRSLDRAKSRYKKLTKRSCPRWPQTD
ncbi:MAG: hypothetical protein R3B54_16485 [Bdellovibrionota bacterium]